MMRIVSRGFTACADAYLTPCIKKYVEVIHSLFIHQISSTFFFFLKIFTFVKTFIGFFQCFVAGFKNQLQGVNVLFMQSDGGLTPMDK